MLYAYTGEPRPVCLQVAGGLGDQVCAEPVIRWMVDNHFKNDDIILMTQHPEIFKHLPVVCHTENVNFEKNRISASTHPPDYPLITFHMIHPVDFISLVLFRRTLTKKDRQIKLTYSSTAKEKIKEIIPAGAIAVHPGTSWESKTFSVSYWQSVIDLLKKDWPVVIIGADRPVGKNRCRPTGYQPIDASGCVDLRDRLNLEELFAIIDHCPVLITNDSGPAHIAGAFDNWLGLIPSCKHPDFILPFRKSSQEYKTRILWKKDVSVLYDFDPLIYLETPFGDTRFDEKETLTPAEEVLEFVRGVL